MLEHRLIRDSWANFKQHFPLRKLLTKNIANRA